MSNLDFNASLRWETFVLSLIANAGDTPRAGKQQTGCTLPMYVIPFARLDAPPELRALISEIATSARVVDRGPPGRHIGSDVLGAMRQIHQNAPRYLPTFGYGTSTDPFDGLTERAKLYERYARTFKANSNGRGGDTQTTGYVEYTAGTNTLFRGGNRARIAFDYVFGRLYFSPIHYETWVPGTLDPGPGQTVAKVVDGPYANPWFWITDITST